MRISDRYIGKQVLLGTLFAILVLSLVLVLGSLFREIRPLLVEKKIPPMVVCQFALNILPFSLMFTIPWGFLSAVLLVFGRLSSDQELTGFRVAGMSLPRIAAPVFALALVLSGVCAWINVSIVPEAKAAMRTILFRELMRDPKALLNPGIAEADFGKNTKVYVEGKDGDAILGLHMYQTRSDKDPITTPVGYIYAQRVEPPVVEEKEHRFKLVLDNSFTEFRNDDGTYDRLSTGKTNAIRVTYVDTKPKIPKPAEMSNDELRRFAAENPQLTAKGRVAVRSEITRRYAYSMACLAFAFIGVPLGIKSRRRDTSTGLVLSVLVGAGYFLSSLVADQFHTDLSVTMALWAPNVILLLIGLWLFRRSRFK